MLGIILIHTLSPVDKTVFETMTFCSLSGNEISQLFNTILRDFFSATCNPLFFLISGMLIFWKDEPLTCKSYLDKMKKRATSLLVPYVLWNLIYLGVVCLSIIVFNRHNPDVMMQKITRLLTLDIFFHYNGSFPLLVPFWFMRDLILVSVLSPVFYWLSKKVSVLHLVLLFILFVFKIAPDNCTTYLMSFTFFALGIHLSLTRVKVLYWTEKLFPLFFGISLLLVPFGLTNELFNRLFLVFFIPVVLEVSNRLVNRGVLRYNNTLAKSTFFVYAVHTIYITELCVKGIGFVFPDDSLWIILWIRTLLTPVLVALICVSLYKLINHLSPKVASILSGNR